MAIFTKIHCPKCGGNIYLDFDFYDQDGRCLQCSYVIDLSGLMEVKKDLTIGNHRTTSEGSTR